MADLASRLRTLQADAQSVGTAFESPELRARFADNRRAAFAVCTTLAKRLKSGAAISSSEGRKQGREFAVLAKQLEELQRVSLSAEREVVRSMSAGGPALSGQLSSSES